jgi:hypothetical protein
MTSFGQSDPIIEVIVERFNLIWDKAITRGFISKLQVAVSAVTECYGDEMQGGDQDPVKEVENRIPEIKPAIQAAFIEENKGYQSYKPEDLVEMSMRAKIEEDIFLDPSNIWVSFVRGMVTEVMIMSLKCLKADHNSSEYERLNEPNFRKKWNLEFFGS